jgi:transposase
MEKDESATLYQALSTFCNRYDPADEATATDHFTSKEIQSIVREHTGITINLQELFQLLDQMHYKYKLEDDKFKWLVRKP